MPGVPLLTAHPHVHVIRATFTKADHGKVIGTIPNGSKILGSVLNIGDAFDAGATLAVGWSGSTSSIMATATAAPTVLGDKAGVLFPKLAADQDVILTLGATNYAAGSGEVWIKYSPPAGVT
jgi:hypothetical protein